MCVHTGLGGDFNGLKL